MNFVAFLRFLIVGGTAFGIDAAITLGLLSFGLIPWVARVPAIATAMLAAWWLNRRFTFQARVAATRGEALKYFVVASSAAILNYVFFLVLVAQDIGVAIALVLATSAQAVFSFFAFRQFVFGRRTPGNS
jgi:putative flippase GtrA